ncbi:MAG: response regulator [Sneathiellales bacterium]|nr:response regulator [Sneathiellales bacterium]
MKSAVLPENEQERLSSLESYNILDTSAEDAFDRVTRIVAKTIDVPISLVSLVDRERQWFKSRHGLDASETPREVAFCAHVILGKEVFVVEDSFEDERFFDNPLATDAPNVRFYAGAPLVTAEGYGLGTLCAIDTQPRTLSEDHARLLQDLASLVVDEFELRKAVAKAEQNAVDQMVLRTKAETAERSKSQFLASMSHEIRTPLNAVIGLTDLTLQTDLSDQQRKNLIQVSASGNHLLGVINDILDFSKLDVGKMSIEQVEFDLDSVLQNACTILGGKAEENNNELIFNSHPNVPEILIGDPLRLGQILINLVSNAIKFTFDGSVIVDIKCEEEEKQPWLVVEVKDTGIGITEVQMSKLFKAFSQVDDSTTRAYGGTGLGLSICKSLTDAMGGKISAISQPGKGSTFRFQIPLQSKEPRRERVSGLSREKDRSKILVIEDCPAARHVLAGTLEQAGFTVETAENGKESAKKFKAAMEAGSAFSHILVDWKMQGWDGLETIRRIRDIGSDQDPQITLMLPALGKGELAEEIANLHIERILHKPINTAQIAKAFLEKPADNMTVLSDPENPAPAKEEDLSGRVLLVEDNEVNRMITSTVLERNGYRLEYAENGEIALQKLQQVKKDHFDVILMDLQMPVMDGRTATRKIRDELGFLDVPIIAMSAHTMHEEIQDCLASGMNGHIAKPLDINTVASTINQYVLQSRTGT